MRVEAHTIQGKRHKAKLNGKFIEYVTMADDEEGVIEALLMNPEYLQWLHNDKVPKKVAKRYAQHRITDFADVEVLGTFPEMEGDVPPRFLCVRLRGNVEIVLRASK